MTLTQSRNVVDADLVIDRDWNDWGIAVAADHICLLRRWQELKTSNKRSMRLLHPFQALQTTYIVKIKKDGFGLNRGASHLQIECGVYFDGAVKHWSDGDEVSVVAHSDGTKTTLFRDSLLQGECLSVPPLKEGWWFRSPYGIADSEHLLPL